MMKLRTIVLGVVACGLALCARRLIATSEPEPEPERVTAAPSRDTRMLAEVVRLVRVDRAEQVIAPLDESDEIISDEPEDTIEERRADRLVELAAALDKRHGAIVGRVRDIKTAEPLAGVTIVAGSTTLDHPHQAAISDENGFYEITNLPVARYHVTFYFLENTNERNITVGGGKLTPLFQTLETTVRNDEVGVTLSSSCGVENHYIVEE